MRRLRLLAATALLACCAGAAHAQTNWAGPFVGIAGTYGWGTTSYYFNTDGYYNDNIGDAFSHAVRGYPLTTTLGYDWQNGRFVHGIQTTIISGFGGISAYDVVSPIHPADDTFTMKFHWAATTSGRIGFATDRLLFYIEGGAVFAHLISEASNDTAGNAIRRGAWGVGPVAGAGVEIALSHHISLAAAYRFIWLPPFAVAGLSQDGGGTPVGGTETDHTVAYMAHMVTLGVNYRFGLPEARLGGYGFDWGGPYVGIAAGAPRQIGVVAGYNIAFGKVVIGAETAASYMLCCGLNLIADATGRVGVTPNGAILFYAEGGIRFRNGQGMFYTAGGGFETVIGDRSTAYMELARIFPFGGGTAETTFRGGINFHPF